MQLLFHFGKILPITFLTLGLLPGAPQQAAGDPAATEAQKSKDPLHRDSPQSAVFAFIEAYRAHDYHRAAKYLNLRKLPPQERMKEGPELATKLGQILTHDTQFDVAELSRDPEGGHADSLPADRERVDSFMVDGQKMDLELERVSLRSKLQIAQRVLSGP